MLIRIQYCVPRIVKMQLKFNELALGQKLYYYFPVRQN